jgi:hypothetical protein
MSLFATRHTAEIFAQTKCQLQELHGAKQTATLDIVLTISKLISRKDNM